MHDDTLTHMYMHKATILNIDHQSIDMIRASQVYTESVYCTLDIPDKDVHMGPGGFSANTDPQGIHSNWFRNTTGQQHRRSLRAAVGVAGSTDTGLTVPQQAQHTIGWRERGEGGREGRGEGGGERGAGKE